MDTKPLLDVFEAVLRDYPRVPVEEARGALRCEIEKRRYDLQDEALIEKILADGEEQLEKDFRRSLANYIESNFSDSAYNFLKTEEGLKALADLFLLNVENSIDQMYNLLVARHFSEP